MAVRPTARITRVAIQNYKSIAKCRVALSQLTVFVGQNGSGKSNFLDAILLASQGLQSTLENAIRERNGINEVRRRSGGHPTHFAISIDLAFSDGTSGHFAFRVGAGPQGAFRIQREQASISSNGIADHHYVTDGGEVTSSAGVNGVAAQILPDRFFLTTVSALPGFRPLYEAISNFRAYNIVPSILREPQQIDAGEILLSDGANIASVIRRLERDEKPTLERVIAYLREIVPGIESLQHKELGSRETLEFRQRMAGAAYAWRFNASNMSDGTLRVLGQLVALLYQPYLRLGTLPGIAIEEPESHVHPGAAAVVADAILEASKTKQVIVTTHSPDLLDHPGFESDSLLSFENHDGETRISSINVGAKEIIRKQLSTAGTLLRKNQLWGDERQASLKQADLFPKLL
jgi:predicted ATPase